MRHKELNISVYFKKGLLEVAWPEHAAELRVEEDVAAEGMAEDIVEAETAAGADDGAPMEAALRPMVRLLTGPWPEGVETVAGPTEEAWGAPSDTCAAAMEEEEEGTDEGGTAETEEVYEECRLKSPSTPGCCKDKIKMGLRLMKLHFH